ncbi:hypothetical protein BDN72DRAFT_840923 [Pluteus cervinus]|uniref:Uncharacterized protein n=1 Tax=Pluteus cervinus TaxID=181527 RepID=A0ACD3AV30_9AGAR|nr:hypothetical protein BDN72DRAFT_840923 [Pluteus cervinus]
MHIRPSQGTQKADFVTKPRIHSLIQPQQHGAPRICILLDIPAETLTAVTSHLDPDSLFSLAAVNKILYEHVKDENTWHRAFANQFLGISPEDDLHRHEKRFMLRRTELTWRKEFILHDRLSRRWQRSRHSIISHIPVYSSITGTLLLAPNLLLSSSLQYGVVSRSLPLTGRVLRGYLSASGNANGWGVGNPNAEFNPNVSACSITSEGSTAKIAWGYHSGEVAVLTANKATEIHTQSSRFVKCTVSELHDGAVLDVIWDERRQWLVTGGSDSRVKLWIGKTVRCLWASESPIGPLTPDPCVKVASALNIGCIVGAMRSGKVVLWTGFTLDDSLELLMPSSITTYSFIPSTNESQGSRDITLLFIDSTAIAPRILVAYRDDPHVYRLEPSIEGRTLNETLYGDTSFGPISTVAPFFAAASESSFILTGDHLGCVSVYDWSTSVSQSVQTPIAPIRKFEAHEDGSSIAAIAWNGTTLVTGSARGATHVWDALTFDHLATFSAPTPSLRRPHWLERDTSVKQIILGPKRDVILVNVGDGITTCVAGPMTNGKLKYHQAGHGLGKKKSKASAKYLDQVELQEEIADSKHILKQESDKKRRTHARERAQRETLSQLGLDEAGAIDYLMMLSREEAIQRPDTQHNFAGAMGAGEATAELELYEDDLEQHFGSDNSLQMTRTTLDAGGTQLAPTTSSPLPSVNTSPRSVRSRSNKSAGSLASRDGEATSPSSNGEVIDTLFPHLSIARSNSNLSKPESTGGAGSSPRSWTNPGTATPSNAWHRSPRLSASSSVASSSSLRSTSSTSSNQNKALMDDLDDDLRFAIELSLAEARSRGEGV